MPGQGQRFGFDGLAVRDGKLLLLECKSGAFSFAAKRGDRDAIERRINILVTVAHAQAIRALESIGTQE